MDGVAAVMGGDHFDECVGPAEGCIDAAFVTRGGGCHDLVVIGADGEADTASRLPVESSHCRRLRPAGEIDSADVHIEPFDRSSTRTW